MTNRLWQLAILGAAAAGAFAIWAQVPAPSAPKFQVASVRLSKNPEAGGDIDITPGRFKGKDLALQWLILTAYRINSGNLTGTLPNWTIADRYDIDARTEDASDEGRVLLALQDLLKDRFKLAVHREMQEEPVYFLTIAKGGIKMPKGSCVPKKQDLPNECYSARNEGLVTTMDWRGVKMSDPAGVAYRTLSGHLTAGRRPMIDKTGLTGIYDVHLRWTRDPEPGASDAAVATADPTAPSIFDAMEQQLGLKLEAGRGPVEYVVVDHVEKPSDN